MTEPLATVATIGDRTVPLTETGRTIGEIADILSPEWDASTTQPTTDDPHYFRLPFTPGPWHVGTPAMYPARISRLAR